MAAQSLTTCNIFSGVVRPVVQRPRTIACAAARPVRKVQSTAGSGALAAWARRPVVARASESDAPTEDASAPVDDEPIWVKREREKKEQEGQPQDLPYGVYLLLASILGIAVVCTFAWLCFSKNIYFI